MVQQLHTSLREHLLAGSTLEDTVPPVALLAVGHSFFGTITVADEIENNLHLLVEAQRFKRDDLRLAVHGTLLRLNRNLERHLEARGRFIGSGDHTK